MPRSSDINQRIVLTGAEEVRRHLESIAQSGQRAGNQTRQALLAATSGANSFTGATRSAAGSTGQMRNALTNLSFQVNDVATSLASGGDAARVFAQQGGQIFQVFQQGGGARAVLGAAASAIGSMITPMTVAAGAAIALTAAVGALFARALNAQNATRQFDVILEGLGKSGQATGADLEKAAQRLRDVGLSAAEARTAIAQAIREGIKPAEAEKIVRIGQDLNTVLGEGSLEQFITAAAKGGEPLRQFAVKLGIISDTAQDSAREIRAASSSVSEINNAAAATNRTLVDLERNRQQSIADVNRRSSDDIVELTRRKGTAQQEIERSASLQIEEINRQNTLQIENIRREHNRKIDEINAKRNEENQKKLTEYNKQIEDAANKAFETGKGLIDAIGRQVDGLHNKGLTPTQKAIQDLGIAWNDMLNTLSQSEIIAGVIRDVQEMIRSISDAVKWIDALARAASGAGVGTTPAQSPGEFNTGTVPTSFAAGGMIRGPGGPTSDIIPVLASNGEFVMRAASVRHWGADFFDALNRFQPPKFAAGGLLDFADAMTRPIMPRPRAPHAAARALGDVARRGGTPVHLHLGGDRFALRGEVDVVDRLTRKARTEKTLSLGLAPGWVAG